MENQDFPWFAEPPQTEPDFVTTSSFGATLRQSQIRLQAFGPDIAGARTSADLQFDFPGGVPNAANGATIGLVRLRPGTIQLEYANNSIVPGQHHLFFAPLAPAALPTLPTPPR